MHGLCRINTQLHDSTLPVLRTPHKSEYGFTPDVAHLMEFELWEPILILYEKNQFPDSQEIFDY